MSKRLAKVPRMLSMAFAAPLLPPPNHQLPRVEAGWRWSSLSSAAARVGFGGFKMSKKLSSPSESLFADAAAERAEDEPAVGRMLPPVGVHSHNLLCSQKRRNAHWPVNDYMIAALHYYYMYMI